MAIAQLELSVRDHARNVKRTITKSIFLDTPVTSTPPVEVLGLVSAVYSPSKEIRAVLRETGDDKDKKRFVEIWRDDALLACKDVTDKHGIFFADDFFSSLSFSPSEKSIIYAAEKKKPSEKNSVAKFKYQQPFGEGLIGKSNPGLFLFEWESDKLSSLQYDCPAWFGQALFHPSQENKIFATGYEAAADEKTLGILFCFNHPSGIWEISLDRKEETEEETIDCQVRKLTDSHLSCRSPRVVTGDGKSTLLWIAQDTGGPHWSTASLHSCDITHSVDPSQTRTLVEKVWEPENGGFPGLYPQQLPRYAHIQWGQGDHIIVGTGWGSRYTIVLISLKDGAIRELTPVTDDIPWSWTSFLTAEGNRLLGVRSFVTRPPEVVLGEFDATGSVSWKVIHKPVLSKQLQEKLDSLTVKIVPIPERFPAETILIQHKTALEEQKIQPCITLIHGGPHAAESVTFTPSTVASALEGYTISVPNYTGSTGYGEKYIRALIGKCGTLDVGDCIQSVRHLVRTGVASEGHGCLSVEEVMEDTWALTWPASFQTCLQQSLHETLWYLLERWPLPISQIGVLLNSGLITLSFALARTSRYTDAAVQKQRSPRLITPEKYKAVYDASPIAHVHNVKAAMLLLVGDSDKRVPPIQGVNYYHALRALRGDDPDVELLMFGGEGHALDGLEASKVVWNRTAEWFNSRAVGFSAVYHQASGGVFASVSLDPRALANEFSSSREEWEEASS
ncbi:hypothetical protein D9757_014920 [Collybiopsis confluens]|uniref:acylaminoacyl-peptidase n=1 Tax=Collybiopsis confluens TaxID=2823264 RepID=A0A8H5FNG3_9AGAR|nr:hypothetical protein D9757_014920 [Collybiopsis confluens]